MTDRRGVREGGEACDGRGGVAMGRISSRLPNVSGK